MSRQVMEILTLQTLDDEAASLRAALNDAERRLQGDPELEAACQQFAAAETALADSKRQQRQLEGQIAGFNARIAPEETRLYDGSVKNPKELASIQHEVELLRASRSKVEDELFDLMSRLEGEEREHARLARVVAGLEERWRGTEQRLRQEVKRLNGAVLGADVKREAQKAKIPPRSLFTYEDVRRRKGSLAVARVQGSNCAGCRIAIPETLRRLAMTDSLAQCPNCDRILYVG